jgi:four helix bundle protein
LAASAYFATARLGILENGVGTAHAPVRDMARHYTELIVWRLANELRIETFKLTQTPPFASDFKLRDQVNDAVSSVCRNIPEGFGRGTHGEFAWFLTISVGSLNELQDLFTDGRQRGHVTDEELRPARRLSWRLSRALRRFIAYLKRTPHRRPGQRPPRSEERRNRRTDQRRRNRTDQRRNDRADERKNDRTDER